MNKQIYNGGTIELASAPHSGRQTVVGVFAINAETNKFHFYLKDFSREEVPDLEEETFNALRVTISNWLLELKKQSSTSIETLTAPRGGPIQFIARGSFFTSPDNPSWFDGIVAEYLGHSHPRPSGASC